MTRREIISLFRQENPEISDRVVTDVELGNWCEIGDKEICAITRCVRGSTSFTTIDGDSYYDLTDKVSKFYDIDEYPGGGVVYDGERIELKTIAELDDDNAAWRSNNAGSPDYYYRDSQNIRFEREIDEAVTMIIYAVLISNDFDDDNKTPFNQLSYLEPFHPAILRYLQWRAKAKQKGPQHPDALAARQDYYDFTQWMRKMLGGTKFSPIYYRKSGAYS